jgi:GT2 family glycosyltransferase
MTGVHSATDVAGNAPAAETAATAGSPTPTALGGDPHGSFAGPGEPADVAVLVVTYNSAHDVDALIAGLRAEARELRLRVVVADNDSADGTLTVLSGHPDVIARQAGGNLGYAGGINAARRHAGQATAVLVLNPDLVVEPGAIRALFHRMVRSDAGIVVPQLLDEDRTVYTSLRREPTLLSALGDALLGSRVPNRPGWLSEIDYNGESYGQPHRIQWSTGAALLIRSDVEKRLADWDDDYFLYSEDIDYFRRAREVGIACWYEPAARMRQRRGGSGSSPALNALMAVNRIRYIRKYHSTLYAAGYRAAVVLSELLRLGKAGRRGVLRAVLDEDSWDRLPHATRDDASAADPRLYEDFPEGAVIIPAHNEASVIGRTLGRLAPLAASGQVEVIVACNGCTDNTAELARSFKGVRVLDVPEASKVAALNAADAAAARWPRLYLDADIEIDPRALRVVFDELGREAVLAARPAFRYDTEGASGLVRSFYRARNRIPSTQNALWGAGAFAVSQEGRKRFRQFPSISPRFSGDDLFVDQQFLPSEKKVLSTPPVMVRTPRHADALLGILRRNYRAKAELGGWATTSQTVRELMRTIRSPQSAMDASVYAGFVALARLRRRRPPDSSGVWERDESSRL